VPSNTLASPLTTRRSPLTRVPAAGSLSAIGARGRDRSGVSGPATARPPTLTSTRRTVGNWVRVWTRACSGQRRAARAAGSADRDSSTVAVPSSRSIPRRRVPAGNGGRDPGQEGWPASSSPTAAVATALV
jgi:hypothetical protein